jgi:hypothetical protein
MLEKNIQSLILIAISKLKHIGWRNNTGMGWIGHSITLKNGDVMIRNARPLHAGLCVGSSDIIGIKKIKITQEMVGKEIGQFLAIEVKQEKKKPTKEQQNFIDFVNSNGGIGFVARSEQDIIDNL